MRLRRRRTLTRLETIEATLTLELDIIVEAPLWHDVDLSHIATPAVDRIAAHFDLPQAEACLLACNDARIAELNHAFRGKASATNVLSWPSSVPSGPPPAWPEPDAFGVIQLGDIALAYETCRREAEAAGLPLEAHLAHLIVHAVLHLLGYDHENDGDAALMEALETELLGKMGISDPY